ncbi:MAG: hypothetical protein Q7U47_05360 [Paludibacter sp.]|nr:hypothetical protein [Paludibacter sp.]
MIKRGTAIFFILLANIILLAHAVVPHHHHNEQICIINLHCQTDSEVHQHDTTEHNHEHDGNKNSDCCVLKQAVVIPANSVKQDCKCLVCNDNHSPFIDFQAVLFNNELKAFVPIFVTNAHVPLKTSSYTFFINTSLGLRAPPTV